MKRPTRLELAADEYLSSVESDLPFTDVLVKVLAGIGYSVLAVADAIKKAGVR